MFFWLVDQIIARIADVLERAALDIDTLSGEIFGAADAVQGPAKPDLLQRIARIGRSGDTAGRARESLLTLRRVLLAVGTSEMLAPAQKKEARTRAKALTRDVASLTDHAAFLTGKIGLLLDATLGMINIEQNAHHQDLLGARGRLPAADPDRQHLRHELRRHARAGLAARLSLRLLLMVLSAILPFAYFKRRGWL